MVQDTLLYKLSQAGKAQRVFVAAKLREIDLHPGQDGVLMLLKEKGAMCLSDVGLLLAIQPPTVTKMTVRLERNGYIRRRTAPQDQRKCMIELTEKGEEKVAEIEALWQRADADVMQSVSPTMRAFLDEALADLEASLYRKAGRWKAPSNPVRKTAASASGGAVNGRAEAVSVRQSPV
ncbi:MULTISPECIES: MarR family winged helix-turn-helix transcriptional regulator [Afifella]|uniref:MarR family winged helix-turn-helix transcriptional regulator n=1 Tax=Afifella TaxID=643217 RepID=UPI000FE3CDE2|nr:MULTISPECIES: MarR family transcriptional regulator [Afifella]MCT8268516.1 MarR family transcriptional regulator [Afifella sp. JA880]